jgi:Putative zinc-finger
MSVDYTCGSERAQAALAGYLYGEVDAAERAAIEAHLAICAACSAELAGLGATRSALASWAPPEAELGFQIVAREPAAERPAAVLRPARWWQQPLPAWAQAAAAVLIFAAGASLGMRAGTSEGAPPPAVASTSGPVVERAATVSADDLAALEARLRREMTQLRSAATPPQPVQLAAADEQVVQRVRTLLAESEQRQQREMAIRLSQVLRDVDTQRRMDLARIEQTFGQMEGVTGAELLQQREAINYLRRVSSQRPQ